MAAASRQVSKIRISWKLPSDSFDWSQGDTHSCWEKFLEFNKLFQLLNMRVWGALEILKCCTPQLIYGPHFSCSWQRSIMSGRYSSSLSYLPISKPYLTEKSPSYRNFVCGWMRLHRSIDKSVDERNRWFVSNVFPILVSTVCKNKLQYGKEWYMVQIFW